MLIISLSFGDKVNCRTKIEKRDGMCDDGAQ